VSRFLCTRANGKTKLYDRDGFDRACAQFGDGEDFEVTVGAIETDHTRQQEKGFHAMISPWAREEGIAIEDLKRDLLAEIFGLREHTDILTGVVVLLLVEPHTSKLSKKKYNELIERTLDIAARMGHVLIAPSEWRERHQERVAV
jgi:hypothetical protein